VGEGEVIPADYYPEKRIQRWCIPAGRVKPITGSIKDFSEDINTNKSIINHPPIFTE
jgi:hypothetical protein